MAEGGGISCAGRQKKPVAVTLLAGSCPFEQVAGEPAGESPEAASGWGYLSISIESDAPFLLPEKSQLTDEDFIGSTLEVPYYVKKSCHACREEFWKTFDCPAGADAYV